MNSPHDKPGWFSGWPLDIPARQIRMLSVLAGIGLIVGCIFPLFDPQPSFDVVRYLGFSLATIVSSGRQGGRRTMPGELDERERTERAMAMSVTYVVTAILIGMGFWWFSMNQIGLVWLPNGQEAGWLLGGLLWLHLMLPGTLLAWREPPPDGDDPD